MDGQAGWQCQGRQEHGWFGSGTCDTDDAGGAERADAAVRGSVGAMPAALRARWSAALDRGGAAAMAALLTAWGQAGGLDRAAFRARFLPPMTSDAVTDKLREAARAAADGRTAADLRRASEAVAAAAQAVGLDRWSRFAAEASAILTSAEGGQLELSRPAPHSSMVKSHQNSDLQNHFFDTLDAPLSRLAAELGLPREFILGLSSYESGWYNDHNRGLNNPLGLTAAGKNNLAYTSVDEALAYWKRQYGPQVRGAVNIKDFVQRLLGIANGKVMPGWHVFNTINKKWAEEVEAQIGIIARDRESWLGEH